MLKLRLFVLFSNSLRSNENNLIYFLKQLGNKGKRKFSASRVGSRVPKSKAMGEYHLKFLRLSNNDSRLFSTYSNSLKFYCMKSVCLFIYLFCVQAEFLAST